MINKLFMITGLIIMTNSIQAKEFFGVDIDLMNTGVEVRVNDIPIYSDTESGQLTVELPSSEYIVDGTNTLTVVASLPMKDGELVENYEPGAFVIAKLFRQVGGGTKNYLTKLKLALTSEGKLELLNVETLSEAPPLSQNNSNNSVSFTTTVTIDSPFPKWAWLEGENIESNKASFESLLQVYLNLYKALASNNQALLKKLYENRADEISTAYYLDSTDLGHKKISTGMDAKDPELELLEFLDEEMLQLQVFANGRLARLITPDDIQPIAYIQEDVGLFHIHKFMFYKNTKNEWVMIR